MAASIRRRRRRLVIWGIVCLTLAGGAIAVAVTRKPTAKAAGAAPSIFKTATVKRGDLTTTESVDGSVQLSSTLTVLHRIEGQTSSSSTPANTSTSSNTTQTTNANNTGASTPLPINAAAALIDCPATTDVSADVPADTTTTTTPDSTPTTTPDSTTTTTTAATTEPSTTAVTEPCDTTGAASPTTAAAPTDTTTPVIGGAGSGRTGGASTGARPTSGSTGASASTARITQTITSIVAANTAIQQGDVLYTVDGSPVVALDGALPAWRSLSTSSDDGADIAQLEASLVAMGYDPSQKVVIDNHFDSATRTMIKAWQRGLGVDETGTVALGSVVFLPAEATVSEVARAVGDTISDGDAVMTLATPMQEVLIDVPTGDEAQVVPGLEVTIGQVQGAVTRLRSANRNGSVVVEAVIAPAAPITDAGNGSSVKVTLTLQNNSGALIAPAEALVSRLDGTYAVEEQTADGSTKWLTVDLLGVSGGNIAIRGDDVSEGMTLLLPA